MQLSDIRYDAPAPSDWRLIIKSFSPLDRRAFAASRLLLHVVPRRNAFSSLRVKVCAPLLVLHGACYYVDSFEEQARKYKTAPIDANSINRGSFNAALERMLTLIAKS